MSGGPPLLAGAGDRLIAGSVPARYFAAGLAFHLLAWLALSATADRIAAPAGGLGPPLAVLHLVTLGVLAMVAIGALLQLLPVALKTEVPALDAGRAASWLLIPGVPVLAWGMASGQVLPLSLGGIATAGGLSLVAATAAAALARARGSALVVAHVWASIASLTGLALLGLLLLGDFVHGWLGDHVAVARLHLIIACYGFLGLLIAGLSQVLVPMFALAPNPPVVPGWVALGLAGIGLALSGWGQTVPAAAVGLGAALLHVVVMVLSLRRRARRRLGPSFAMIGLGWAMLPASLLLGGALAAGLAPAACTPIFGLVLVGGWLLSTLIGVLMRILPFLAMLHLARSGRRVARIAGLGDERLLWAQAGAHPLALLLVGLGVVLGRPDLIWMGGMTGAVGAGAFIAFAAMIAWRLFELPPRNGASSGLTERGA